MGNTDKLFNDLYKYQVSFRNIEEKIIGVVLDDYMFIDEEDVMHFIYYRFNGFIRKEIGGSVEWEIDTTTTSQADVNKTYYMKSDNQRLLKERVYILLIEMSDLPKVMKIINQS